MQQKGWALIVNVRTLLENRDSIDRAQLLQHVGHWVALSEDGKRVLAGAESLDQLEATLAEQQIDPQAVFFEFIPGSEDDLLFSPETTDEVPLPK